jgi:hypothetical protein
VIEAAPIGVVLDQAGMLSFARGDARLAELIVETAAQGGMVGLPAVALLAAHVAALGDDTAQARLGVLAVLPAVRVLPMAAPADAYAAASMRTGSTDLGRTHAAWAASEHRAYYVTTEREPAPLCLPSWQIYVLPTRDG